MTNRSDALELARSSLAAYGAALRPDFEIPDHIRIVVDALERLENGKLTRLLVILPPRHGKSLLCSQIFPSWFLGRNPTKSVITASYGESLATDFGRTVRGFLADDLHRAIFPNCQLAKDVAAQNRLATTQGGFYFGVGRGGAVTGRGCDLLVLDDLLKDYEEAHSETIRKSAWDWLQHVALTRLSPTGAIVAVGTRWHEADPLGRLTEEVADCEVIHFPAIAEGDECFRKGGEALWPSCFPLPVLEQIRAAIGERAWMTLYQGRPSAAEGSIFRREWFRTYTAPPDKVLRLVQSWDVAAKMGAANDYSVCTTWATTETGYYLLGLWRGKCEFPDLKRQFAVLAEEWRPDVIVVEDSSAGIGLIQELKSATRYSVLPVNPSKSKELRALSVTPMFEAGKVLLPQGAFWLDDLMEELCSFPSGVHDDMVDSTTQALNYLRGKPAAVLAVPTLLPGRAYFHLDDSEDFVGGARPG